MTAWLLPLGVGLELVALAAQWRQLSWFAAAALACYFILQFRHLLPYPRILGLITLGMLSAVALSGQAETALWGRLASSAAYYSSFLGAMGLMQLLAKRLPHLRELHKALLAGPALLLYPRYVLTSGSIGSILNFGMLSLLCGTLDQHLRQYDLTNEQRRAGLRSVMVTTLRGFALVPLIAPTSITIAMITREMPELSWAILLPYGLVAALLLVLVGWHRETRGLLALSESIGDDSRATGMGKLVLGSLLGLAAIGVLAWLTELTPSQAAMILIPVCILIYLLWCERSPRRVLGEMSDNLIGMHNEMFIFGCAALMGGVLGVILPLEALASWLAQEPKYNMLLAVGSLFGTILLAIAGVAPIVSLSLLVGLLAELARLGVPIMTPALGLMSGFSIAMIFSPFGPSTLILARFSGESPYRVAFVWNGRFVITALPLLLLLLFVTHWLHF